MNPTPLQHALARSVIAGTLTVLACAASAQPTAQLTAQPSQPSPPAPAQTTPSPEPTLDQLLGLEEAPTRPSTPDANPSDPTTPNPKATDPTKAELNRELAGEQAGDDFTQAIALMDETTARLASAKDPGAATQRLQKDILAKLDKLIDQANKKGGKGKPKPGGKPEQPKPSDEQKQSSQAAQPAPTPGGAAAGGNVPRQSGDLNAPPQTAGAAAWGNLPPHVRDALMQGSADSFSSLYKQLTEEYYKKLAEDPTSTSSSSPPSAQPGSPR